MTEHRYGRKGRWNSEIKRLRDRVAELERLIQEANESADAGVAPSKIGLILARASIGPQASRSQAPEPGYDRDNPEVPVPGLSDREERLRLADVVILRNCRIRELEMQLAEVRNVVERWNDVDLRNGYDAMYRLIEIDAVLSATPQSSTGKVDT